MHDNRTVRSGQIVSVWLMLNGTTVSPHVNWKFATANSETCASQKTLIQTGCLFQSALQQSFKVPDRATLVQDTDVLPWLSQPKEHTKQLMNWTCECKSWNHITNQEHAVSYMWLFANVTTSILDCVKVWSSEGWVAGQRMSHCATKSSVPFARVHSSAMFKNWCFKQTAMKHMTTLNPSQLPYTN